MEVSLQFWSRQGELMDGVIEWARAYEDAEQRNVAVDYDEATGVMVSTIWMGMSADSHRVQDRPFRVFETAYLLNGELQDLWRTDTEEQALAQHAKVCMWYLSRPPRPEDGHLETINERSKRG